MSLEQSVVAFLSQERMREEPRPHYLFRIWKFLRHAKPSVYKMEEKGPTSYGIEFEFDWPQSSGELSKTKATDVVEATKPNQENRHE